MSSRSSKECVESCLCSRFVCFRCPPSVEKGMSIVGISWMMLTKERGLIIMRTLWATERARCCFLACVKERGSSWMVVCVEQSEVGFGSDRGSQGVL